MNILKASVFAVAMLASSAAFAQSTDPAPPISANDCTSDAECPDGYACIQETVEACYDCEAGTECPPCMSESFSYCEPPPPEQCGSDADCAEGDICVSYVFESCSGSTSPGVAPACDPDDETCADPAPVEPEEPVNSECTTESESYCVPPYVAPCEADLDCGPGFTCETIEICECSVSVGGGTTSSGEPGSEVPAEEPDCTCAPSDEAFCKLIEVTCDTDAECADGLLCVEAPPQPMPAIACAPDTECPDLVAPEPESFCAPDDYVGWGGAAGGVDRASEVSANSEGEFQTAERVSWGEEPTTGGSDDDDDGCSVTGVNGGKSAAGLLPLLFGFFAFRRRRRS